MMQSTTQQFRVYSNNKSKVICGVTVTLLPIDHVTEHLQLGKLKMKLLIDRTFTDKDSVTFVKTNTDVIFDYNIEFPSSKKDYCVTISKFEFKLQPDTQSK